MPVYMDVTCYGTFIDICCSDLAEQTCFENRPEEIVFLNQEKQSKSTNITVQFIIAAFTDVAGY
jgi:hypothetical protein